MIGGDPAIKGGYHMRRFSSLLPRRIPRVYGNATDSGQSLIETALAVPFLLLIALNAINFAYYFFVAINLAASPRNGVEWSVQGFETPAQLALPNAGTNATGKTTQTQTCQGSGDTSVSTLTFEDMTQVLPNNNTGAPCPNIGLVQVCSASITDGTGGAGTSGSGTSLISNCQQYGTGTWPGGSAPTPSPDPEAPNFVLNRVDVVYVVKPLIAGSVFGIRVLPTYTFHRQVSMREMN